MPKKGVKYINHGESTMQYDEEFLDRVASALAFEHVMNLAMESAYTPGWTEECTRAFERTIKLHRNYQERWKKLLQNTELPQEEFEQRCLQKIFPRKYGPDVE